jgi:hypothetical protein
VPGDPDEARRQKARQIDHLDSVGRLERELGNERNADARTDEALHRAVVVGTEDDARLGPRAADRRLDGRHAPALAVADQRLLRDLAERRRLRAAGER